MKMFVMISNIFWKKWLFNNKQYLAKTYAQWEISRLQTWPQMDKMVRPDVSRFWGESVTGISSRKHSSRVLFGDKLWSLCCLTLTDANSPSSSARTWQSMEGSESDCAEQLGGTLRLHNVLCQLTADCPNVVQCLHLVEASKDCRCWNRWRKSSDTHFGHILMRSEMFLTGRRNIS